MGILDDVMINAKTAAEVVGKKAGQIVDVSKLRFNVAELNAELSKLPVADWKGSKIVTSGTGADLLASPEIKKAYLGG